MKKIAFLSLVMLVCGVDASFAAPAYKCQLKDLTGTPPNRNEYIYPYSGAYQPGERAQSRAIKCAGVRDNENCDLEVYQLNLLTDIYRPVLQKMHQPHKPA